jgi:hypothetical protein
MGADHTGHLVSFFLVLAWLIAHVVSACQCVFKDEKIAYEAVHVHDGRLESRLFGDPPYAREHKSTHICIRTPSRFMDAMHMLAVSSG